jgi:hypothetical protein
MTADDWDKVIACVCGVGLVTYFVMLYLGISW